MKKIPAKKGGAGSRPAAALRYALRGSTWCAILVAAAGLVFAQGMGSSPGWHVRPVDPKRPPPLGLTEAYTLAMGHVGPATNRFWCVTATCLETAVNYRGSMTHWTFGFSSTNGEQMKVLVLFDGTVARQEGGALVK